MPKLPRVKLNEVIRALENLGFVQVRQRGSHIILKKQVPAGEDDEKEMIQIGFVVPLHRKNLAVGTLRSILNQAGVSVSVEEFLSNL